MRRNLWILLLILPALLAGCRPEKQKEVFLSATEAPAQVTWPQQEMFEDHGYEMTIKSAVSESSSMYVTFGLSAPEDVDLSALLDRSKEEYLSFGELQAIPSVTQVPANVYHEVRDDGDGKRNTVNVLFWIAPVIPDGSEPAFGPGKTCILTFDSIQKRTGSNPKEILASGHWAFTIDMQSADQEAVELLNGPVTVTAEVSRRGETEYDFPITSEPITLTSIELQPLQMIICFEAPEPLESFDGLFVDQDAYLMMKDGRKIGFFQTDSAKETAFCRAEELIFLNDADYLQFSDGTRVAVHPEESEMTS